MGEEVPVHESNHTSVGRNAAVQKTHQQRNKGLKKFSVKQLVTSTAALLLFVVAVFIGAIWYQSTMGANIDNSKLQAVFFTNGQVYFGKLQTLNGNYMKLSDVYYLQAPNTDSSGKIQEASGKSATMSPILVKLGGEIHGPEDEMVISKDQILFFENLKTDGAVSKSIKEDQKK